MFFSKINSRVDKLDRLVREIDSNMENNYKDAAQSAFRELTEQFQKLQKEGKLNERQETRYSAIISRYSARLKGYTHKDQKPYWTGQ